MEDPTPTLTLDILEVSEYPLRGEGKGESQKHENMGVSSRYPRFGCSVVIVEATMARPPIKFFAGRCVGAVNWSFGIWAQEFCGCMGVEQTVCSFNLAM